MAMKDRIISALRVLFVKRIVIIETYPDVVNQRDVVTMWSTFEERQDVVKLLRSMADSVQAELNKEVVN